MNLKRLWSVFGAVLALSGCGSEEPATPEEICSRIGAEVMGGFTTCDAMVCDTFDVVYTEGECNVMALGAEFWSMDDAILEICQDQEEKCGAVLIDMLKNRYGI